MGMKKIVELTRTIEMTGPKMIKPRFEELGETAQEMEKLEMGKPAEVVPGIRKLAF